MNIVNSLLEHAVYENASDIHVEPGEKEVIIRYRIDDILKSVMTLPKNTQSGIVARVKILANLKLDEHMIPQDGRFKIQIQDERLAFRVSILPVYDGEKIVMRLLHEGVKPLSLDQLGFLAKPKATIEIAIKKPHGMILVTGPTGSGKTIQGRVAEVVQQHTVLGLERHHIPLRVLVLGGTTGHQHAVTVSPARLRR